MSLSVLQNSFLGGELSPSMYGRMDDALYQTGVAELNNFIIKPSGAIQKRSGFKFVHELDNDKFVRLIPFRFASDQTLVLIFSDHKIEFATQGSMVLNGSTPYSISTPFSSDDLKELEFSQNADVVTITHRRYAPMELRRYGATDWRIEACTFSPEIKPPTNVLASAKYPTSTDVEDKGVIEAKYVVTSIDKEGKESLESAIATVLCNYYLNGGSVIISWRAAADAQSYRVYREVCGVFGFLGETEGLSLTDEGQNPDTAVTPPRYEVAFTEMSGIKAVEVIDGGENYGTPIQSGVITRETRIPFPWGLGKVSGGVYPMPITGDDPSINEGEVFPVTFQLLDAGGNVVSSTSFNMEYQFDQIYKQSIFDNFLFSRFTVILPEERNRSSRNFVFSDLSSPVTNPRLRLVNSSYWLSDELRGPGAGEWSTYSWERKVGPSGTQATETNTVTAYVPSLYEAYAAPDEVSDQGLVINSQEGIAPLDYSQGFTWSVPRPTEINSVLENYPDLFAGDPPAVLYKAGTNFGVSISEWLEAADRTKLDTAIGEDDVEIQISDPTGSGAVLQAVVQEGKIVEVVVVEAGKNYTNPTLTVISKSGTGHGAKLKAILYTEDDFDYPSANTQYDQRRIFAGTIANPLKVWMTNAGKQDLMMYHRPILSDDRINVVAVTNDADRIKHAVALESLILFTSSSELRVFAQNSDALTPNNVAVRVQSYIGANNAQPVIANNSIVYVAARGGHPRQIAYSYNSSGYNSDDIGIRCPHLFDNYDITDLTLMKAPIQTIWAVSTNGALLTCIYIPEQKIVGWARVTTDGIYEGVCAVSEGEEDHVYAIVKRRINGVERKYLERMSVLNYETEHSRIMDSYLENVFTSPQTSVRGLGHLEGKEVAVFVDGAQQRNKVVSNGSITLDKAGYEIAVGLPITARFITLPLEYASNFLSMTPRALPLMYLRTKGTGDLWAGIYPQTSVDKLYKCDPDTAEFAVQNSDSNIRPISINGSYDYQTQLVFESRDSLPIEILAIMANIEYANASKYKSAKAASTYANSL